MLVFVKNKHGENLMPCKPSKARKLLKQNKAQIVQYEPFTIQLLYGSSGYKQPVDVGIDLGAKHIGIAIQSENKVITKGEIELRSDIKSNIDTRRQYRRSRRHKKTRYRKPRFDNRKRSKGWLPPSIQSRIDNTFHWIDKFVDLLPNPKLNIEVGKKDFIDSVGIFKIKQFRKKKRSLHEATARKGRKEPNKTQKRNSKNTKYKNGYYLNDKVKVFNKVGFISGFTSGGSYVKDIENNYITIPGKTYK